jgi:hypothetical protein
MRPSRPQPVLDAILEAELASPCATQTSDAGSKSAKTALMHRSKTWLFDHLEDDVPSKAPARRRGAPLAQRVEISTAPTIVMHDRRPPATDITPRKQIEHDNHIRNRSRLMTRNSTQKISQRK